MFTPFSHYLGYGATDQTTIKDLAGTYQGLVVPGTVASWQRDGTGGFVLTMSATASQPDYVLDSRFPLFQQALPEGKPSHRRLAATFGDPALVRDTQPSPADFAEARLDRLAAAWVEFNRDYRQTAGGKFAKYAERLQEQILPEQARSPSRILAPYFVATGAGDPWWAASGRFFDLTLSHADTEAVVRVVATDDATHLAPLLAALTDKELVIWVSGLNENECTVGELRAYRAAIAGAHDAGKSCFGLYGGFFSVLAASAGLAGFAQGIGYSESRAWPELPVSGPAPARFYLPRVHRYVRPELAQTLYAASSALVGCTCAECVGQQPLALEYHGLMRHAIRCRTAEIADWIPLSGATAAQRLSAEADAFEAELDAVPLPPPVRRRAQQLTEPVRRWVQALS